MKARGLGLAVLVSLAGPGNWLASAQPSVQANDHSIAVGGNVNNSTIIIGLTFEQHKQELKAREQELKEGFQATLGQSEEHRKTIQRELQGVQGQLGNLQKSYEERVAELKRVAGELEALRGQVPDAKLREALEALTQGKTKLADALFAEVESKAQQTIELAARAAFERGRLAEQEVRWQEARGHFEKADRLVPDHAEYSLWAARIAQQLGYYAEAEPLFTKAIAIREKALPANHPDLASWYNNLAVLYLDQGRRAEAEPLLTKAITIGEKALPANHPDLAIRYNNLASLYQAQGRLAEAEPLFTKAIAIGEKALPANHPDLATWYNNLASLYQAQGRLAEAEALFTKAVAIGEKALPAGHPSLAVDYSNLAAFYQAQGRLAEAEPLFTKAIAISEKALPAGHPTLVRQYNSLASLYRAQGRPADADALLKRLGKRKR